MSKAVVLRSEEIIIIFKSLCNVFNQSNFKIKRYDEIATGKNLIEVFSGLYFGEEQYRTMKECDKKITNG